MDVQVLTALRHYFKTGNTKTYGFRIEQLKRLKKAILDKEQEIYDALYADLKKSPEETWVTETGMVIAEINAALRHLKEWMEPERVNTNLVNLPSASRIYREPLGVVLIIGPWNYPFQLLINPLVGAIAAGNCAVIKPSESAPATAAIIQQLIDAAFPPGYILCVQGEGHRVIPQMMKEFTFDHVFYTGNTTVGRLIYQLAADKLTPVTLELGGKSPCVVESDANINVAARRITIAKFSNAGQMCVAPDYILVHHSKKDALINAIKKSITDFFGDDPSASYNYCSIINHRHFDRLLTYLDQGTVCHGGKWNKEKLFIEPTLLTDVSSTGSLMKEEIFGPLLPIIEFSNFEEAKAIIEQHPDPLAFYVYTSSRKKEQQWLQAVPSGGACINNSSWHLTNHNLPFGGRGYSGTGHYHGRFSFETFSHRRAVMKTPTWFDPAIKYPPFKGKLKLFRWIIK